MTPSVGPSGSSPYSSTRMSDAEVAYRRRATNGWKMRGDGAESEPGLDERIAAAFNDGVNSTDVETLINAAEAASVLANERAELARTRALDPALSSNVVIEARRQMEDAAFQRDRLQVAVTKLRERLIAVKADEEDARAPAGLRRGQGRARSLGG